MGLATIDPDSRKVHTKLFKISKFGVNRPNSKQDTPIWKFLLKINKEMYGYPDAVRTQRPDDSPIHVWKLSTLKSNLY